MPGEILVQSFPGPDRSIPMEELSAGRPVGCRYRNRRIGEFLKELELSEGRNTGIPTIQKAMADNGSPAAQFETDENRTFLLVRLPLRSAPDSEMGDSIGDATPQVTVQVAMHDKMLINGMLSDLASALGMLTMQVTPQVAPQVASLLGCADQIQSRDALQKAAGLTDRKHFRKTYLNPLIKAGWLAPTLPDKPNSPLQKYSLTDAGRAWLAKYESLSSQNINAR